MDLNYSGKIGKEVFIDELTKMIKTSKESSSIKDKPQEP